MRILLVGENHRAEIRGRTIAIHGLACALRDRGHAVTLVQAALPEHRVSLEGIESRYISSTRKSRYPLVMGGLTTRGFDVVHTNDEAGAWLAVRSRLSGFPLVAQLQPPRLRSEGFFGTNWRWRYIRMAVRYAPALLTPSQWLADELIQTYRVPPARIQVVPYGVKAIWFDARRKSPDAGSTLRVALVNMKGTDVALRAFAKAASAANARLDLFGVHRDVNQYRALAGELGIERQVRFRGFVDHEALPAELAGADILLHPAQSESFGQVLAEAAALGIPAVASRVGAIPEVVRDGETGLLAPVGDVDAFARSLARLVAEPALRSRLAAAAARHAEGAFRWERAVERLEHEVYAPLIAARRRRVGA